MFLLSPYSRYIPFSFEWETKSSWYSNGMGDSAPPLVRVELTLPPQMGEGFFFTIAII